MSTSGLSELQSVSDGGPGAESTRLDSCEISQNLSTSKEVSDLLNDIRDLNNDIKDASIVIK